MSDIDEDSYGVNEAEGIRGRGGAGSKRRGEVLDRKGPPPDNRAEGASGCSCGKGRGMRNRLVLVVAGALAVAGCVEEKPAAATVRRADAVRPAQVVQPGQIAVCTGNGVISLVPGKDQAGGCFFLMANGAETRWVPVNKSKEILAWQAANPGWFGLRGPEWDFTRPLPVP